MNRLLVAVLAAFDAVIAVAVGVAATLAPLTLLWVFGFSAAPQWGALWPVAVRVWQLGHFVPVDLTLPEEYLTVAGLPDAAASFTLSLAPLAFAVFTAVFAARSGSRAAHAGAWLIGVLAGTAAVAALATGLALTATLDAAPVDTGVAVLLPVLVFAVPALLGALVRAWREGDGGLVDAVRERFAHSAWAAELPAAVARGTVVAVLGLIGIGALLVAVSLAARGGEVIALFEAAHVDLIGAIVLALGQLAYLPTMIIWAASFAAGPGFAVGAGTAVSPAATSLGVVPGIPVLGALPESTSSWMLLLALTVIGVGALAGGAARGRLRADPEAVEPLVPRIAALVVVAVLGAAAAALLAVTASGSIGPGRLAEVGPAPGPFALAVGVELAIGAAIMLLSPRHRHPEYDYPAEDPRDPSGWRTPERPAWSPVD
ncbi:hypothetical protein MSA03_28090 [Microbacterium saccharophilum]|uniref:cell division protein PerM n=1 Tax=Microbacterium saccharophilum TaxID=1213358 RepID=UPI0011917D89|nr:DUF6350 family protein [Microbacterium saccharophilum]GEP49301.1 hypothetical protein MSA03_28090 [Microbacterium saccharophilum]